MGCCKTPRQTLLHFSNISWVLIWTSEEQIYPSISQPGKNNPKNYSLHRFSPPPKQVDFFNHFRKVTIITDIFYVETLFPHVSFLLNGFLNKIHKFFWQLKKRVFPKNMSQWRQKYVQHTSKDTLLSSEFDDVFTDSLVQPGRELWPIITSKATIVEVAGPKFGLNIFFVIASNLFFNISCS